jgi:hypothetical protein
MWSGLSGCCGDGDEPGGFFILKGGRRTMRWLLCPEDGRSRFFGNVDNHLQVIILAWVCGSVVTSTVLTSVLGALVCTCVWSCRKSSCFAVFMLYSCGFRINAVVAHCKVLYNLWRPCLLAAGRCWIEAAAALFQANPSCIRRVARWQECHPIQRLIVLTRYDVESNLGPRVTWRPILTFMNIVKALFVRLFTCVHMDEETVF